MFDREWCPNCNFEDYDVDNYWDDFDENDGVRVWECICPKRHKHFNIVYNYKCTGISVEVSAS